MQSSMLNIGEFVNKKVVWELEILVMVQVK